jgi:hypothetical protein
MAPLKVNNVNAVLQMFNLLVRLLKTLLSSFQATAMAVGFRVPKL